MAYAEIEYPLDSAEFYKLLKTQIDLYIKDAPDAVCALSNASAVLKAAFPNVNWVGFYLVKGEHLVLGPFQGKPAVMTIGYGQGVCGSAWKSREAQVVRDVHCFVGHISCDCSSASELVVPIFGIAGEVLGVVDMDSPIKGRFEEADAIGLASACEILAQYMQVF